jgi:hypothetical protein
MSHQPIPFKPGDEDLVYVYMPWPQSGRMQYEETKNKAFSVDWKRHRERKGIRGEK